MSRLIVVLLLATCLISVSATTQKTVFEYKVENGISESKLNGLSDQGWELVTSGNYNGGMPYVILKRPK